VPLLRNVKVMTSTFFGRAFGQFPFYTTNATMRGDAAVTNYSRTVLKLEVKMLMKFIRAAGYKVKKKKFGSIRVLVVSWTHDNASKKIRWNAYEEKALAQINGAQ